MIEIVKPKIKLVNFVILTNGKGGVWLQKKKDTNPLFDGKLTCPGGKVDEGESINESAERELWEETGLVISKEELRKVAIVNYVRTYKGVKYPMHVYTAETEVPPSETDELGKPELFQKGKLPYSRTLPDMQYWFDEVLDGKKVHARFDYSGADVTDYDVRIFDGKNLVNRKRPEEAEWGFVAGK